MSQFILCPSGSHGDVHPYIAVGQALKARGHRVVMNTSPHFEALAKRAGFEFDAVGTEADFQAMINDPNLWHPTKSLHVLFGGERFRRLLRDSYQHIQSRIVAGDTLVVAGSLAVAARIAHDSLGVPLATIHLQPMAYPSASDPPLFPRMSPKQWWPAWLVRAYYWYGERFVVDKILGPPVNGLRAELGLRPIRRIWGAWRHSPQCILGFFPEWFGSARDWPPHFRATGFVRYDQSDSAILSPALERFLNAGEPPIVISFGSAMRTGRAHFEAALAACVKLKKRALILARGGEQIPSLSPDAFHADYAPFSMIFHRAAAVIHHGGIGSAAQAMAAGVPQLIMPLAFDQFDNAARLMTLGVARSVPATHFTAERAANALSKLLNDASVPVRCREAESKMCVDALPAIVDQLESCVKYSSRTA